LAVLGKSKLALTLRGSRDFSSLATYETFVQGVLERRNRSRQERLREELAVMRPVRRDALVTHSHQRVRVSRNSLISVQGNAYSVPTSLIGQYVNVHIHEWHLEVYHQTQQVLTLPRLSGQRRHHINYRHLIDSLLRKPGGFRDYRYRDALFPTLVFQRAWEHLNATYAPRKADLIYLRVLHLAAHQLQSDVAAALGALLEAGGPWDDTLVAQQLQPTFAPVPALPAVAVDLQLCDELLREGSHVAGDATRPLPHVAPAHGRGGVGRHPGPGPAGGVVAGDPLLHLLEQELEGPGDRRIARLLKAAHLPAGKTLETFSLQRLPLRLRRQLTPRPRGSSSPGATMS